MHFPRFAALLIGASAVLFPAVSIAAPATTWMADNGNGTYTNPLFADEFTDPDIIRVGDEFILAGTTMHAMPGLVVLRSRDLVNWSFASYATPRLDLGPEYRLEEGKEAYGQGIWAPCLRHHKGVYYLFSNVNRKGLQVFTSKDPAGPWEHRSLGRMLHDLSVLFDDDGKVYAIFGYDEVRIVELRPDMAGVVEGTERVLIPAGSAMGEGHHFYKLGGKYYIVSADYAPVGRMQCARADSLTGPWETAVISAGETMGTGRGLWGQTPALARGLPADGDEITWETPGPNELGAVPLHQGGIVQLPNGDWWGVSMMDYKSIGRTTFLSPVTWKDGWPYFGLPGNLGRSPRTWVKPAVGVATSPTATYRRSDDFEATRLQPVWQWNHVPVDGKWSLTEKPGALRLHTLPAPAFLRARNTLTQRVIGPASTASVVLDVSGLKAGDTAGLGLLNIPAATLGVVRREAGLVLRWYSQAGNRSVELPLAGRRVTLRVEGDYERDAARFSYSVDGAAFQAVGEEVRLPYQLKTFQGVRYSLFAYNTGGAEGGHADFDDFRVDEPLADRSQNIPFGKVVLLENLADGSLLWAGARGIVGAVGRASREAADGTGTRFRVLDRGAGRVALQRVSDGGFLTITGQGLSADVRILPREGEGALFQWQDLLRGECMLLSLRTQRYVGMDPVTRAPYAADWPGARPDRKDGTVLRWAEVK